MENFNQWSQCSPSAVNKLLLSYFRQYQLPFLVLFWTPNCNCPWTVTVSDTHSVLSQVAKTGLNITTERSMVQPHTSCVDELVSANIYVDRFKKITLVLYSRSIKHCFIWHVHCCPLRCFATINTYNLNAFNLILCQERRDNKHALCHCVYFSSFCFIPWNIYGWNIELLHVIWFGAKVTLICAIILLVKRVYIKRQGAVNSRHMVSTV